MPNPATNILLVEDDESLGFLLQEYLRSAGYDVRWLRDGDAVLPAFEAKAPDLCLLDIMMPKVDGFQVAKRLRQQYPMVPFIFLSARSLKSDILRGFELGADDYLKKPIDEEELLARTQAVLHRSRRSQEPDSAPRQLGQLTFDPQSRRLTGSGKEQVLSERENDLLEWLSRHPGEVVSGQQLLVALWGKDDYFARKSMDVYLYRLRKYLQIDPKLRIVNVRGRGYYLDMEE